MNRNAKISSLSALLALTLALFPACGGDDSPETEEGAVGTLVFVVNGEDFARQGFVSEDDWRIDFTHVWVNVAGPTVFQVADTGEEVADTGEEAAHKLTAPSGILPMRAHAGHPHAEIPEGSAHAALTGAFFVDVHQGTGPTEIGRLEDAAVGNYNYLNFNLARADARSVGVVEEHIGYSVIMIGSAKNNETDETVQFTIRLTEEVEFTSCGPHPENAGVVSEGGQGTAEVTLHFDHIFGDLEEGPADPEDEETVNFLAVGFAPFAGLAQEGALDVDQEDLEGLECYQKLVTALRTLGHFGEAHCLAH